MLSSFSVIPLARKLETCGVFGVSSDEYLNYALNNRKSRLLACILGMVSYFGSLTSRSPCKTGEEWAAKGKDLVREYLADLQDDSSDHIRVPFDVSPKVPATRIVDC